jgi:CPA2 family monovalent cation:H+ antiporter-2
MLLFTPLLGEGARSGRPPHELLVLFLKTIFLVGLVYVGNRWLDAQIITPDRSYEESGTFHDEHLCDLLFVALLTSGMVISLAFGAFWQG